MLFFRCHPEYGERVAKGPGLDQAVGTRLAAIVGEKRVKAILSRMSDNLG